MVQRIARVNRNNILLYWRQVDGRGQVEALAEARDKISEEGYNGRMSPATTRKVQKYIRGWIEATKARKGVLFGDDQVIARSFSFVTLTLPAAQAHTDYELKRKALVPFLQSLKRGCKVSNYLWRAEKQENGNLHFHVLVDAFIEWKLLRKLWNQQLEHLGYIEMYRQAQLMKHKNGFTVDESQLKKRSKEVQYRAFVYGQETNWSSPNSTDIHRLAKVRNAASYVCKYVTKDNPELKVTGRIWGCSDGLKLIKCLDLESEVLSFDIEEKLSAEPGAKRKDLEHAVLYEIDSNQFLGKYFPEVRTRYVQHWNKQAQWLSEVAAAAEMLRRKEVKENTYKVATAAETGFSEEGSWQNWRSHEQPPQKDLFTEMVLAAQAVECTF